MDHQLRYLLPLTDQEKKTVWEHGIIVLDTSILLDFYRVSRRTRCKLMELVRVLKGRLWMPFQIMEEYLRNRPKVILEQMVIVDKVKSFKETIVSQIEDFYIKEMKSKFHPFLEEIYMKESIVKVLDDVCSRVEAFSKAYDLKIENDSILKFFLDLFNDCTGKPYPKEKLEEIYRIGADRFKKQIPPGYKDNKKDGTNRYGDLIVWYQILDIVAERKIPVIFVTSDTKEDWWHKEYGKKIGPRFELRKEILSNSTQNLLLYNMLSFLDFLEEYVNSSIDQRIRDEINELEMKTDNDKFVNSTIYFDALKEIELEKKMFVIQKLTSNLEHEQKRLEDLIVNLTEQVNNGDEEKRDELYEQQKNFSVIERKLEILKKDLNVCIHEKGLIAARAVYGDRQK